MALYPITLGQKAYARWMDEGGKALILGDSIVFNLQSSLIGGLANIDGIGSGIGGIGVPYSTPQWSMVNDFTQNVLPGFALYYLMPTITMASGVSPDTSLWNSKILGTIGSGHFFAGTGGHAHVFELMSLQQAWLKDTLASHDVIIKVPFYMGTDGVVGENVRLAFRLPGQTAVVHAYSEYFSTYRASNQVVWKEVLVPAATLSDGYQPSLAVEYRPSTATVAGEKVKFFSSQITQRATPRSNGITVMFSGIGGATSTDYINAGSAQRNVSIECVLSMIDGLSATHLITMIGQNGSGVLSTFKSDMTTLLNAIATNRANVKKILLSSFATVANAGGELGSMVHVQGASELAASRNDVLHLNLQRLAPDFAKLYLTVTGAWSTTANGTAVIPGEIYSYNGSNWLAKTYFVKTSGTPVPAAGAHWLEIGAWSPSNSIVINSSKTQVLGDGVHPTYPLGHQLYRQTFQDAHRQAALESYSVYPDPAYVLDSAGLYGPNGDDYEGMFGFDSAAERDFIGVVHPGEVVSKLFVRETTSIDLSTGYTVKVYHNDTLLSPQPTITPTAAAASFRYVFTVPSDIDSGALQVQLETIGGEVVAIHGYDVEKVWATAADVNVTIAPGAFESTDRNTDDMIIDCYVQETIQITQFVLDRAKNPVSLTGKNLIFVIETKEKQAIATVTDIDIVGDDNNGFQLDLPTEATTQERVLRCSLRDVEDGKRVWGDGFLNVRYSPRVAS